MLICRVFDVLYFAVFQQCKIKTAKQKTASLTLAVLMCVNTYFDTICVHPMKSAYTLSKFAYS